MKDKWCADLRRRGKRRRLAVRVAFHIMRIGRFEVPCCRGAIIEVLEHCQPSLLAGRASVKRGNRIMDGVHNVSGMRLTPERQLSSSLQAQVFELHGCALCGEVDAGNDSLWDTCALVNGGANLFPCTENAKEKKLSETGAL